MYLSNYFLMTYVRLKKRILLSKYKDLKWLSQDEDSYLSNQY